LIVTDSLCILRDKSKIENPKSKIAATRLFMAGASGFWQEFAASLTDFGPMRADADSLPVLELATDGSPGLVIHAGTGSFVAARGPDGALHYAGGIGWRFGDPGSGYELGRRAIARALLELQGWQPRTRLATLIRDHTQLGDEADAATVTRFFYQHGEPNRVVAALAPAVLRLAAEGDSTAVALVTESAAELLALAVRVAQKLFPHTPLDTVRAGLSGALLTNPVVAGALAPRAPFALTPITEAPIEGVRRLLVREKV
jgi:N-acetylglucosamine kinase-like BadF-type ATPase